jgi:hypothetical protein
MLEFVYNALNLLFTWFSLANFYVFFASPIDIDEAASIDEGTR